MKLLIASAVLFSGIVMADAKTIHNDPGGYTDQYFRDAATLAAKKESIRLSGYCASACTLYLQKKWNLDVCATRGAILEFHMPYMATGPLGDPVISQGEGYVAQAKRDWRNMYLGKFNAKLNAILAKATKEGRIPNPAAGDHRDSMFKVRATDVFPKCKGWF